MKTSRFTESQIVDILGQAARNDMMMRAVCDLHGISEQTIYRWKRTYGEMGTSDVRRLRELEADNARLKRMLSESALELDAIKDVLRGK